MLLLLVVGVEGLLLICFPLWLRIIIITLKAMRSGADVLLLAGEHVDRDDVHQRVVSTAVNALAFSI